jgi:ribose transport system ATP-binding protein
VSTEDGRDPAAGARLPLPLLQVSGLRKHYGAVVALENANLSVAAGEVHALLGANGAGKSTLVKMLTGVIRPDGGLIAVRGQEVYLGTPAAAHRAGLGAVFQDPAVAPDLTVLENLRLTGTDVGAFRDWLARLNLGGLDLGEIAGDLPLPALRIIDLARVLARTPDLLILDEITAALPSDLAESVFGVMRLWRDEGRAVLFISHRLGEVRAICDHATVLRDGHDVGTLVPSEGGEERIVSLMMGASGPVMQQGRAGVAHGHVSRSAALTVRELSVPGALNGVSFDVHPGEVLGVAALEGQGQEALFDCLAGRSRPAGGEIRVGDAPLAARRPADAIRAGVVLVPADRVIALLPQRSVRENIVLPFFGRLGRWGDVSARWESQTVAEPMARLAIDTRAQGQVRRLSGGNQQKVTVARWLATGFRVLLCFDPTRGIDVGTKRQIYALLRDLADRGAAILLYTSELAEVPLVCDHVLVLYEGKVVREMAAAAADEAALLRAAHGLTTEEATA